MLIERVNIYKISLYFTGDFSHSRRSGPFVDNIIVELIADGGEIKGYGEGAPRGYVTGESGEEAEKTVLRFIRKNNFPWDLNNASQIWDFVDHLPDRKEHNSATCAIEMALLDALGKSQNRYIAEYFPKDFYTDKIYYGGAVTLTHQERVKEMCEFIKMLGLKHLKIKMGQDFPHYVEEVVDQIMMFPRVIFIVMDHHLDTPTESRGQKPVVYQQHPRNYYVHR